MDRGIDILVSMIGVTKRKHLIVITKKVRYCLCHLCASDIKALAYDLVQDKRH